jgi:hypothetical protein
MQATDVYTVATPNLDGLIFIEVEARDACVNLWIAEHGADYDVLSHDLTTVEARELRDALTVAIESAEAEGRSS